jgi:hypothetical protein
MVASWASDTELYEKHKLEAFNKACTEKILDDTFSVEKGLELYSVYTAIITDVRFLNSGIQLRNAYIQASSQWNGKTSHIVNDSYGVWLLYGVSLVGFHEKMLDLVLSNYQESLGPGGYALLYFFTYLEREEMTTLLNGLPLFVLYEIYAPIIEEIKLKGLL